MTDYIEFSQKIKEKYPQYKNIDDLTLAQKMVEKYPQYKETITFEETQKPQKKNIDLTPSGLYKNALVSTVGAPLRMAIKKEDYATAKQRGLENLEKNKPAGGLGDFLFDMAVYSRLPMLKSASGAGKLAKAGNFIGNAAIQGGVPGVAESLKRDGSAVGGAATGTGIAALLQGIPYVGKGVAKPLKSLGEKIYYNAYPGIKADTVRQLVKPNSKALDLTNEQADRLALDTLERFRGTYRDLLNKKGDTVGNLLEELPENKTFDAEALSNLYDGILNSYSLSSNKALNPAKNITAKELDKIRKMLYNNESGKINPKELYDINKNINTMIDWDKPGTALKNEVLEKLYLANSKKIGDISPELKAANKAYSDLMDYKGGRSRLRTILNPDTDIETATSKLKNYKSTNDNIFQLEKQLIDETGAKPFLDDIDDVNAAKEYLESIKTGFNPAGLTDKIKLIEKIPLLAHRKLNQSNVPNRIKELVEKIKPVQERVNPALGAKAGANLLYGGVEYNDYQ